MNNNSPAGLSAGSPSDFFSNFSHGVIVGFWGICNDWEGKGIGIFVRTFNRPSFTDCVCNKIYFIGIKETEIAKLLKT